MATMTWGEFKILVDKELKEKGRDDSTEIDHIDITDPQHNDGKFQYHFPQVATNEEGMAVYQ